jgi:hypothetical protein
MFFDSDAAWIFAAPSGTFTRSQTRSPTEAGRAAIAEWAKRQTRVRRPGRGKQTRRPATGGQTGWRTSPTVQAESAASESSAPMGQTAAEPAFVPVPSE